jgi:prolyl oligopeptidase PreP (S9A serine peptidase family)
MISVHCQNAYQRQAASDDHKNDEGLKIVVFNKNICVASQFPEDTTDELFVSRQANKDGHFPEQLLGQHSSGYLTKTTLTWNDTQLKYNIENAQKSTHVTFIKRIFQFH